MQQLVKELFHQTGTLNLRQLVPREPRGRFIGGKAFGQWIEGPQVCRRRSARSGVAGLVTPCRLGRGSGQGPTSDPSIVT